MFMRAFGFALLFLIAALPALGQTAAPGPGKPPAGAAKKPAAPSLEQTYAAMPLAERIAIQTDLVWTGEYNGLIDGEFNARAIAAVKAFQKRNRSRETGVLNPQERAALATAAKARRDHVGWRTVTDSVTGARLGLPSNLVQPVSVAKETGKTGSRWSSAQGQIQIETFLIAEPGTTLPLVFEREKKEPPERKIGYQVLRGDFFVVSGTQGLKKFYVRAQVKEGEVRGMSVLYDLANEGIMDSVVVAMSSAFTAFPEDGPQPRRLVEYGTGVVIGSAGEIITARDISDGCQVITVTGIGNAERIDDGKASGLALLQVYGVRNLKPIALAEATPDQGAVSIVGVADPQSQGGGSAVSSMAARLALTGGVRTVDPAPGPGFSGAAVVDTRRRLVGLVTLKASVVAGTAPPRAQAGAIPVETIRSYLQARHVTPAEQSAPDAKASVVRVICARK
jgi:peptidoglycan hydrolase-like protein with peptidoglycan-binding domain